MTQIEAITALRAAIEATEKQDQVAWKHDCAALLQNDVELWVDRCSHCGKPRTTPPAAQQEESEAEFLAKRLGRVARAAGVSIPADMTHAQVAGIAVTILGDIARKLEAPAAQRKYPLPDDLYDSKDWKEADYAGRVEWLHSMYEGKKQELNAYLAPAQRQLLTDEQLADLAPDDNTPMSLGEAFLKFARLVEAHHGITGESK